MAIWIQSLSWTLIYSLGQGLLIFASLRLLLKLIPDTSANVRYHLSLSALTIMLVWFATTLWQQLHYYTIASEQSFVLSMQPHVSFKQQLQIIAQINNYSTYRSVILFIQVIAPWLSASYIAGLALMVIRLSAGMLQLFSLRKNGIIQPRAEFIDLLTALKSRLHYEGPARLLISLKAQVPMVVGFIKPVILVPAAAMTQLSTEQLETILLHELAHLKRHDYLINILQIVVETVLFFNPFAWLISAIIRREREHCCDDLVLDHTREPLSYATAIAALAHQPGTKSVFTVAATGQSNHLFNRIKRIMEMKKNPFSYSRMVAAILIITTVTCSIAWLTPAFARTKKGTPEKAAAPPKPVQNALSAINQDEVILANRLMADKLIDQVKGFVVEKNGNKLYIDGKPQADEVATKYLAGIKKEVMRVQVFPLLERLKMHPGASFLQILVPVNLSSGCVDYNAPKPGC